MTHSGHQLPHTQVQRHNNSWITPLTIFSPRIPNHEIPTSISTTNPTTNGNNDFNFESRSAERQTFPINEPFFRPSINSNSNGNDNTPTINCFPMKPLLQKNQNKIPKNRAQHYESWKRRLEAEYMEEYSDNVEKRRKSVHNILSDSLNSNSSRTSSNDSRANSAENSMWINGQETNRESLDSSRFSENSWCNPLGPSLNGAVKNHNSSFGIWDRNNSSSMSNTNGDMSNPADKYFNDLAYDEAGSKRSLMFVLPEGVGSWRLKDPELSENSAFFPRPFTAPSIFLNSKVSRQNNGQCQSHDVFSSRDPKFPNFWQTKNPESFKSSKNLFSGTTSSSTTAINTISIGTGNNRYNIGPPKTNSEKPESVGIEKEKFLDMQRRAGLIQVSLSGKGLGPNNHGRSTSRSRIHRLRRNQSQLDREIGNQSWNQNQNQQNLDQDKKNELNFNLFTINPGKSRVVQLKSEYFCCPPVSQLDSRTIDGHCYVKDFEVGHVRYGSIIFDGIIDVAGLNLDDAVEFQSKNVTLYPRGSCPPYGNGLNRKALVMLTNVFPENRRNLQFNYDNDSYEEILKQSCSRFGGAFIEYNGAKGVWTFWINERDPSRNQ